MLAIIGGSGLYNLPGLTDLEELQVETPFGSPSSPIFRGKLGVQTVLFLSRHGVNHQLLPSEVPYRANIWALKELGATTLLSVSAVGSLREHLRPGEIILPNQYIDMTTGGREKTFFGSGVVAHVSTAQTRHEDLVSQLGPIGESLGVVVHKLGTYVCVEGPRLGTRAESHYWRTIGGDVVGMTQVPEVFLAKEAQLSSCTMAVVTDYDSWKDDPSTHVSVEMVLATYSKSLENVQRLLTRFTESPLEVARDFHLPSAILTPESTWSSSRRAQLAVLFK